MDTENEANPDVNRKMAIVDWKKLSVIDVPVNESIEEVAESLVLIGIKPMDALHVASAIEARVEYFLTTDKALLRRMTQDNRMQAMDPVDFIRILSEVKNED